jgi:glycosyltransferase involved in cell wall biosynthesis
MVDRWGIDPERITVVRPAVDADLRSRLRERDRARSPSPMPTILAVGNVLPRKNLSVVAEAVERLGRRGIDTRFRIVGQVPRGHDQLASALRSTAPGRVHITGYVSQTNLVDEYRAADVFVFPSKYEGFGIPALEAMAARVPVVASNATALPETVGDAGLLVDPGDPDEWARAIEQVLSDGSLATRLRDRGEARVDEHSWAEAGALILQALRRAAA